MENVSSNTPKYEWGNNMLPVDLDKEYKRFEKYKKWMDDFFRQCPNYEQYPTEKKKNIKKKKNQIFIIFSE